MNTINISDFRSNLLKYLEISKSGEDVSITSNGKLLATITAPQDQKELAQTQLRSIAESAKVYDVVSSTGSEWDAMT